MPTRPQQQTEWRRAPLSQPVIRETYGREEAYDIAIVGGGPAGAAAALSVRRLRPALRVAIVEASRYDAWRVGETLAPGCHEILQGLGCAEALPGPGFAESPGTRSVWGASKPYDNDFLYSLRGSGWHVDRARFDALLCQFARDAGADLISHARLCGMEREASGFRLTLRPFHSSSRTIRARFVIDTSGPRATFAARCGARPIADDRLIGVCGLLPAASRDATTLVEAQPNGWWYSSLLPGARLLVAWMSDADLIREQRLSEPEPWTVHFGRTEWTRERAGGGLLAPLRVWAAQSQRLSRVQGEGWVAAGDAATTYDPLSSLGILKALRGGKIASFVALDALEGRNSAARYERFIAGEYAGYCETKRWFYGQEQRWPDSPFWRRRTNGDHAKWQTVKN